MYSISVVLASYNGEKYISNQLDSILSSISKVPSLNYEIIVSDDGSIDDTRNIVNRYIVGGYPIKLVNGPREGIIALSLIHISEPTRPST